jgi:hypothetical protein
LSHPLLYDFKNMKSQSRLARYFHTLALQSSLRLIGPTCWTRPTSPTRSVRPSPTESNPVQPNPTTPPPPGKEIGKETVKFMALFDHCFLAHPSESDHVRPNPTNFLWDCVNLQPATFNVQPTCQWSPFHSRIVVFSQDSLSRTQENIRQPI